MLLLLALLAPMGAFGAIGADVISDFNDDGFITGTYTCAELDEAIAAAPADSGQYAQIVAAIQQKQIDTLDADGNPCAAEGDSGGGTSGALVLGIVGAALVVAAGTAVGLQRRSRRDGPKDE